MRVFDKQGKYTINRAETQYDLFLPVQYVVRDASRHVHTGAGGQRRELGVGVHLADQRAGLGRNRSTPAISVPRMAAHSRARRSSSVVGV